MNFLSKATLIFVLLTSSFSPDILATKRTFFKAFPTNNQNYTNENIDYAIGKLKNLSELMELEQKQLKLFLLSPEKYLEYIFGEDFFPIEAVALENYYSDGDECPQCSICLEKFKNKEHAVLLKPAQCEHLLHTHCVDIWLNSSSVDEYAPPASSETRACPLCRKNLIKDEKDEVSFKLIMQKMDKELLKDATKLKFTLLKRIYFLSQFIHKKSFYDLYNFDELFSKIPKDSLFTFSIGLIKENKDITAEDLIFSDLSKKTLVLFNEKKKLNEKQEKQNTQNTDNDEYSLNDLLIEGLDRVLTSELKSDEDIMDALGNIISEKILREPSNVKFLNNMFGAIDSLFDELRKKRKLVLLERLTKKISVEIDKALLVVDDTSVRFFELKLIKASFPNVISNDNRKKILSEFSCVQNYAKKEIWENSDFIQDTILDIAKALSSNLNKISEEMKSEINNFVLTEFVAKGAWEDGYNISSSLLELVLNLTDYLLKLENNEDIIQQIIPALTLVVENIKQDYCDKDPTLTALKISKTIIKFLDKIKDEFLIKNVVTAGINTVYKSIDNSSKDIRYSSIALISTIVSLFDKSIKDINLRQRIITLVIDFCNKSIQENDFTLKYLSIELISSLITLLPTINNDELETKIIQFSVRLIINNTNPDYSFDSYELISFASSLIDNFIKINNDNEKLLVEILIASTGLVKPVDDFDHKNSNLLEKCMRCLDKIKNIESRIEMADKIKNSFDINGFNNQITAVGVARTAIDMYLEKLNQD